MGGQGEYARAATKSVSIAHRYSRDLKVRTGDVKASWTLMLPPRSSHVSHRRSAIDDIAPLL